MKKIVLFSIPLLLLFLMSARDVVKPGRNLDSDHLFTEAKAEINLPASFETEHWVVKNRKGLSSSTCTGAAMGSWYQAGSGIFLSPCL